MVSHVESVRTGFFESLGADGTGFGMGKSLDLVQVTGKVPGDENTATVYDTF